MGFHWSAQMEKNGTKKRTQGKSERVGGKAKRYDRNFREKIVGMHVDDKIPIELLHTETGVSRATLHEWVKRYKESGPEGLEPHPHPGSGPKLPSDVAKKIIEIKTENPTFGIRRIGNVLGRWFGLPGSRETVRLVLKDEGLSTPPKKGRQHNPSKPRFFERATPNQMWQTDIMSFRMGGKQVYLIGFMDDYSRYIVGLGLYASQTAEHVLEVYRKACGEYGVPKEMLTDNGRQYTNWRGKTKFETELSKDKVKHIKSQPHHPQTLGKIERFWKTILEEYLARAQFDSFENARDRIAMWTKHYNHRRPHQGIEGVCPADRYYEVAGEVRKVIERQIEENVLELALRGKPREPFYLVGRMEGQSVVLQAEKGKLKLSVGGDGKNEMQEREFTIGGQNGGTGETQGTTAAQAIQRLAEGAGCAVGVDGAPETPRNLSRAGGELDYIGSMAEACNGRRAAGPGTQCEPGERSGTESAPAVPAVAQAPGENGGETGPQAKSEKGQRGEITNGSEHKGSGCEGPQADGSDPTGGGGPDDGDVRREGAGNLAPGLLRVGGPGLDIDGCGPGGQTQWPSRHATGRGEGTPCEGTCGNEGGSGPCDPCAGHKEHLGDPAQGVGYGSHIWAGR
jgi:transposase InsO family protein